jgi:hypothetical protein
MLDLNYVIGAAGQVIVSATGSTLQSATITTSGFPVQISVTGDAEPGGAGWHRLQIYRDSTAIGQVLHIESAASGLNMTISMLTIDTPVAGTYTYSVKIVGASGLSARYTEMGQLSMIVEEKIISSYLSLNWLRRDISPPNVYYGYSNNLTSADSDSTWSIKKVTTSGSVETVTWTTGQSSYVSTWDNRVESFSSPSGSLGVTWSVLNTPDSFNTGRKTLSISWNLLTGVDNYKVIISESGKIFNNDGYQVYNNPNFNNSAITEEVVNSGSYAYNKASSGLTYSVTITGVNVTGTTASTVTITT